jgi:hypothetical protein
MLLSGHVTLLHPSSHAAKSRFRDGSLFHRDKFPYPRIKLPELTEAPILQSMYHLIDPAERCQDDLHTRLGCISKNSRTKTPTDERVAVLQLLQYSEALAGDVVFRDFVYATFIREPLCIQEIHNTEIAALPEWLLWQRFFVIRTNREFHQTAP